MEGDAVMCFNLMMPLNVLVEDNVHQPSYLKKPAFRNTRIRMIHLKGHWKSRLFSLPVYKEYSFPSLQTEKLCLPPKLIDKTFTCTHTSNKGTSTSDMYSDHACTHTDSSHAGLLKS